MMSLRFCCWVYNLEPSTFHYRDPFYFEIIIRRKYNKMKASRTCGALLIVMVMMISLIVLSQSTKKAFFPSSYFTKVYIEATRKFNFDLIYDHDLQKYRIDSYGVPMKQLYNLLLKNKIPLTNEIIVKWDKALSNIRYDNSNGIPLYSFIFDYSLKKFYSIFPLDCMINPLPTNSNFPSLGTQFEDLLGNATYVGQEKILGEPMDHFVRDYVLMQVDYFQTSDTPPVPRKLLVASESFLFFNVSMNKPDPKYFIVPKDCHVEK
jgi:hypothetical protein